MARKSSITRFIKWGAESIVRFHRFRVVAYVKLGYKAENKLIIYWNSTEKSSLILGGLYVCEYNYSSGLSVTSVSEGPWREMLVIYSLVPH